MVRRLQAIFLLVSWHSLLTTPALATSASDWTPLGDDDFVDSRRFYLSQEGSRVAFYYRIETTNFNNTLSVHEYDSDNQQWTLVGEPLDFGQSRFNFRISGDGNRLLCANRGEFVRIYGYSAQDNQWKQVGQDILPQDVLPRDFLSPNDIEYSARYFPGSLAISYSGTRFAVSFAPEISLYGSALAFNDLFGIGRVWVYEYDANFGRWEVLGGTLRDETSPWFGANLKLSGDGSRLAIGRGKAIQNDQGFNQISLTWRVYQSGATPLSSWESVGADSLDSYGILDDADLSFDGSMIAVGTRCRERDVAILDVCVGQVGKALVLQYENGSWKKRGQELVGHASGDGYGEVSLSGDGTRLAVGGDGAALDFSPESMFGRVQTFEWDTDSETWVQDAELLGDQVGDTFGERVSLSFDGSRLGVEAEFYARVYGRTIPTGTPSPANAPTQAPVDEPMATAPPTLSPTGPQMSAAISSRFVLGCSPAWITGLVFAFF